MAGTPLQGEHGPKGVEEFKSYEEYGEGCDRVVSRDENDEDGVLTVRRVLRTFRRTGLVLNLSLAGGIVIGTTAEHPFYAKGRGWVHTPLADAARTGLLTVTATIEGRVAPRIGAFPPVGVPKWVRRGLDPGVVADVFPLSRFRYKRVEESGKVDVKAVLDTDHGQVASRVPDRCR